MSVEKKSYPVSFLFLLLKKNRCCRMLLLLLMMLLHYCWGWLLLKHSVDNKIIPRTTAIHHVVGCGWEVGRWDLRRGKRGTKEVSSTYYSYVNLPLYILLTYDMVPVPLQLCMWFIRHLFWHLWFLLLAFGKASLYCPCWCGQASRMYKAATNTRNLKIGCTKTHGTPRTFATKRKSTH